MGAGELLIIAVIGLLVLGPERLPVAIRTVSGWYRTIKQMANSVSAEMSHELKVHELHQNLKKAEQQGMENLSPELSRSVQELKDAAASVNGYVNDSHTVKEPEPEPELESEQAQNPAITNPAKTKAKTDE